MSEVNVNFDILEKSKSFYEKNKKIINGVGLGLLILIVGFFGYKKFILEPKAKKAADNIYMAEYMFEQSNWEAALNGQLRVFDGFKKIISKYGGTPEANLSHFYAGVCELHLGKYKEAIKDLEDFDAHGSDLQNRAYGCMGDAYAELGNNEKAIDMYSKASADLQNDQVNAPMYLFRKGLLLEKQGKKEEAKEAYLEIKRNYPQSFVASDIDKYLARVGYLGTI